MVDFYSDYKKILTKESKKNPVFKAALDGDKKALSQVMREARRKNERKKIQAINWRLAETMRKEARRQYAGIMAREGNRITQRMYLFEIPEATRYMCEHEGYFGNNAYYELLYQLYSLGLLEEEIQWCSGPVRVWGHKPEVATWDEFATLLRDFPESELATDYLVVGTTWWMKRVYVPRSGHPEWEFFSMPQKPAEYDKLTELRMFDMDELE